MKVKFVTLTYILNSIKTALLILVTLINCGAAQCQVTDLSEDELFEFSNYLVENDLHDDNLLLLNSYIEANPIKDSVTYYRLKAFSFYKSNLADSAVKNLALMDNQKPDLLNRYIKLRERQAVRDSVYLECDPDLYPISFDLLKAELLINRNFDLYGLYFYQRSHGSSIKFDDYFESYLKVEKKSPVLAGLLSAVVPGLGKFYAGKNGEAVSSFTSNAILGFQFWEHQRTLGFKSFRTMTFAALFAAFYLGNIYGSAVSVKVLQTQNYEKLDNNIMLDIAVPVERIFKSRK